MAKRQALRRAQVMALLRRGDFPAFVEMVKQEHTLATLLLQLLYDPGDLLHWRSIEALGYLARALPAQVEIMIPRLLWLLNEDSGSFGWGAAAALGEIGRNNLKLVNNIILIMFSLLQEEFSRPAMLWGLGRLGEKHPEAIQEGIPTIRKLLLDPEEVVRANAAWCLGLAGASEAVPDLQLIQDDPAPVKLYEDGELQATTVGQIARKALIRLEGEPG
jgi:HEAT repeat protein